MTLNFPTLLINLKRSEWRLRMMMEHFPNEDFIIIDGVDGRQWEDGRLNEMGRPEFSDIGIQYLIDSGILGKDSRERWPLIPCEVGCALGHRAAWEYVVKNELEFAIICEDDIVPSKAYRGNFSLSIENAGGIPEDADVMFLTGEDTAQYPMRTDELGRLLRGWCNYAYVITGIGAEKAIRAQFPMYLPCDVQWWSRAFRDYEVSMFLPRIEDAGFAYAMKEAIVKRGGTGYATTMTRDGKKPWKQHSRIVK